ncbi:ABC transporter ATP-binding protein [Paramicrobacterium sp. CJ85]|uniref:ABC transporter ATP-binding protein n=1 Tax=Paramicrobacterium sp. CJ85 TaxID=3445355 RepID=UPI003F5DA433
MSDAKTPLLEARHLTKTFVTQGSGVVFSGKSTFTAVDDVSFAVQPRETLAIVGESGSGKSTMARIAAKLLEPTAGNVLLDGVDMTTAKGKDLAHFRSKVQVVFQDPFSSLNPKHTVERIVMAPLDYQGVKPPKKRRDFVRDLMDRVGLNPDHSQRYPGQFSGGQAQRIGIARALAVSPSLVVCDEAVSALDVSVQAVVINLLKDLQRERDLSYIFIAHDLAVVRHIADSVAVVHKGQIVEQGDRDAIFDDPQHDYTKSLLSAVPQINPEWEAARLANAGEKHP